MPEPLKNMFDEKFVSGLAEDIRKVYREFDSANFIRDVFDGKWQEKELKERMRHISDCMRKYLPESYEEAVSILMKTASEHRAERKLNDEISFCDMVFPDFTEKYGIDHYDISVKSMEEFTKVSSSEFAVRIFIIKYPKKMMKQMMKWARHKDPSVRRLASEGSRPRLPWAAALPEFKKDPSPILPILEILKNDPELFVRRSAANSLNDISKDNPEITLRIAEKWIGKSENTDWILKHGLRGLLKKGNSRALKLFGFDSKKTDIQISDIQMKRELRIGEDLPFSFQLRTGKTDQKLRLEYEIEYVKAKKGPSRKVFQIVEKKFPAKAEIEIRRKQSFRNMTTRVHYPGRHILRILVNGHRFAEESFNLRTPDKKPDSGR